MIYKDFESKEEAVNFIENEIQQLKDKSEESSIYRMFLEKEITPMYTALKNIEVINDSKFKVGDEVHYTNCNGVYWGIKTITEVFLHVGSGGMVCWKYKYEGKDSYWVSEHEEFFTKVTTIQNVKTCWFNVKDELPRNGEHVLISLSNTSNMPNIIQCTYHNEDMIIYGTDCDNCYNDYNDCDNYDEENDGCKIGSGFIEYREDKCEDIICYNHTKDVTFWCKISLPE